MMGWSANSPPNQSENSMNDLIKTLDPIEEHEGFLVKRGDYFKLGYVNGSKVRQCFHVVEKNLDKIKSEHNSTLITGAGLPSPQTAITAQVAHHFGLKCIISTPLYDNNKVDLDRINISIAQKLGAEIYGVSNPNPIGYEKDVEWHIKKSNPYKIKFGMIGKQALEPVIYQTQNIPDSVEEITMIAGSGLSAISVLIGIQKYRKTNVKKVNLIILSSTLQQNLTKWYNPLPEEEKFQGEINIVSSDHAYRKQLKKYDLFDYTYESKAWDWMVRNKESSFNHLFWVVGVKNRDLSLVEPIMWHTSGYQENINRIKNPNFYFKA